MRLRAIRDPFSIWRIHRSPVVRRICRNPLRRGSASHWHSEEIAVRAECRVRIRVCGETQLAAIRRKRNRIWIAQIEWRHIIISAKRKIARRRLRQPASRKGGCECHPTSHSNGDRAGAHKFSPSPCFFRVAPCVPRCRPRLCNRDKHSKQTQSIFRRATTTRCPRHRKATSADLHRRHPDVIQ